MKYIIANCVGIQMCFVFDAHIRHKDVAKEACAGMEIAGAAICNVDVENQRVAVHGESRSLNVGSRPQDAKILAKFLFG